MVAGRWSVFDYSVKTAALQGRCNKAHCHGPESNYFPIFSALSAKWYSSSVSEFEKKWNLLPVLQGHI